MRRRSAILASLTLFGGAAISAAAVSSASPTFPPPCPTQPLVWQSDGNIYVSVPDPTGQSCRITFEVNGNIQKPGTRGAIPTPTLPPPNACPPHQLVYESDGHDYIAAPDPSGKSCYTPVELPITVPPTIS